MSSTKVPVGVSSLAGYSTSVVTLAGAMAAFLTGDRSRDTLVIVLLGGYSAGSFLVTQVGRYVQAHALAKKPAPAGPYSMGQIYGNTTTGSTSSGITFSGNTVNADPEDTPDPNPPVAPDPKAANDDLDRVTS